MDHALKQAIEKLKGRWRKAVGRLGLFAFATLLASNALAFNCTSNATTGNWGTAGTWTGCNSTTPQSTDTVTILNTHVITLNASPTVQRITVNSGGRLVADASNRVLTINTPSGQTAFTVSAANAFSPSNSTVVINSTSSITVVSGTVTFNNLSLTPTSVAAHTYSMGTSSITCLGGLLINPTKASAGAIVTQINMGAPMYVVGVTTVQATTNARSTFTTTTSNFAFTTGRMNVAANGTFLANGSQLTLNGTSGTLFTLGGAFQAMTSTLTVTSDASVTLTSNAAMTFNHLNLTPTLSADRAYTFGTSALALTGNFNIIPNKATAGAARLTVNMGAAINGTAAGDLVIDGSGNADATLDTVTNYALTMGLVSIEADGTFNASNSTITITGTSGTLFTNLGTFNQEGSNVTFNPNADVTLTNGAVAFNNLNLTPTISGASKAYTFGANPVTVWGNMTVNPTAASALTLTVNMGDDLVVASTRTLTITRTTNALAVFDTNNFSLTAGAINVAASATLLAEDSTITLNGTSGTLLTEAGNFAAGTSEVIMNPDAAVTMTATGVTFYDLTLTPTITTGRAWAVGTTSITVLNNLMINPAGTGTLAVTMGAAMGVGKVITLTGTGSAISTLNTGANYALIAGNLYIDTNETFTANASALTFNGTTGTLLSALGTFAQGTATIAMNPDADVTLTAGTITANALSLTPTLTVDREYTFGPGFLILNGNFTINPTKASAGNATLTVDMSSSITVGPTFLTTISGTTNGYSVLEAGIGVNHPLTTGRVSIGANGTYNARDSVITLTGTSGTLWTRTGAGVFNEGNSQMVVTPDAAVTIFSGTQVLHDLTFSPTLTATRAYTMGTSATLNLTGDLTVNPTAASSFGLALTMGAAITIPSDKTLTLTRTNVATTTFDASGTNYAISAGRVIIGAGSTLNGRSSQISVTGTTSPLWDQAGTFTTTASTVTFNPDADVTLTNGTISFNHVVLAPTLTTDRTYEMGSGDLTMNGFFTILPDKPTGGVATLNVNMGGAVIVAAANILSINGANNARSVLDTSNGSNYSLTAGRMHIAANGTLNGQASAITMTGTTAPIWMQTGTFNEGNSQVTFTGNAAISPVTSGSATFYDLIFAPVLASASRAYTLGSSPIFVDHDLTLNPSGTANVLTVNMGAPIEVGNMTTIQRSGANATSILTATASNYRFNTGNLNVATGGTFQATGSSVTFTGTTSPLITRVGTFTQGTSTITIRGAASATLTSGTITFVNLVIDTPGETQTLGAATTVSGNLLVQNGTLDDGGFQITGNATHNLDLDPGTALVIGSAGTATTFPTTYTAGRIVLAPDSTVTYNAGVNQTVSGTPTYGNVTLNAPSGTPTKTQGAAVVVAGDLTIGANNTYDVSGTNYNLTIGGNYANNGTFNARAGTVTFNGTTAGLTMTGGMIGSSDFNNLTFNGTGGEWTMSDPIAVASTLTVTAGSLLGAQDVTVNGGVVGNGTNGLINLTGGTFEQRVAVNQWFGTNGGSNDWTFNNLTFSNSGAAGRAVTASPTGTGDIVVNGALTFGNAADGFALTFNDQTNNRILQPNGDVVITSKGVLQASTSRTLAVGGNWINDGTFTANASTIAFVGNSPQYVDNNGGTFANVISSNTSAGGLTFSSGFTAAKLLLNTANLNSSATIYFAAHSTFTVSTFTMTGSASYPIVLRSTDQGNYWYLNNTSTQAVSYAYVGDSNASAGKRVFDYPGGQDLGNTRNWAFGAATPTGVEFSDAQNIALTLAWDDPTATPDSYTVQFSTNAGFSNPATSVSTALTNATTSNLLVNTTYYGRVNAVVQGVTGAWSATATTATLANVPATPVSTWTAVNFTSVTVAWLANGNSANTQYVVWLSTVEAFDSGTTLSVSTRALTAVFTGLDMGEIYFAQVQAVNHSSIATAWLALGSTTTLEPQIPSNLRFTGAQSTALTAAWDLPSPAGDTYQFQVSTDSSFAGTLISSSTRNAFATTITPLTPNTTYFGRVAAINVGVPSDWSVSETTATLANAPATVVSTWTAVRFSSLTVNWTNNSNPVGVTLYTVDLATASNFLTEEFYSSSTYNASATFDDLFAGTTYFARVKATNHSGIDSNYFVAGSTKTITPNFCFASASGNWSSPASWTNCTGVGGLPAETDLVTINAGVDLVLNTNATVAGIVFAAPGSTNTLTQLNTVTLTVNGPVTFNQPTINFRQSAWNINAGTATVSGLISFLGANATVSRVSKIVMTSGQLNAAGGISFAASTAPSKVIDMSGGAGKLNMDGTLTIPANAATLTAGTAGSIFNYSDDVLAQTVRFFTVGAYNNLHMGNESASGVTLGAAITAANVAGNLRVQSGTFKNGGFAIAGNAGKVFEVADGGSFEMSGTSAFPTGFGTFTIGSTSRVRYLQTTNPLSITSLPYGHLDLMPAGNAVQNLPAGAFNVLGDLSIGNGVQTSTASANANSTVLTVRGNISIAANATLIAHASNPLTAAGDWTNAGTFVHNNSTVALAGSSAQTVSNNGKAFANVISTNVSGGGVTFASGFSAARFTVNTAALANSATMYFDGGATFTISSFSITGTAAKPVVLLSDNPGVQWLLNNTSTHSVRYAYAQDSDASSGMRILDNPGGVDLGNNAQWVIDVNAPTNLQFASTSVSSVTVSWDASVPAADSYTLQVSTDSNFGGTLVSSTTLALSAAAVGLAPNTTHFARVASTIYGVTGSPAVAIATITLANIPATVASTWTAVQFSSLTVNWSANGNPSDLTLYTVEVSTANDFIAEDFFSSSTYNTSAVFEDLTYGTVHYGRVKATNQNGIETDYVLLGSTQTRTPITCNASASGNWSVGSRWTNCTGPGGIPAPTDAIIINSGVVMVLNVNASVAGLTFAAPGTNNSLTQLSTVTLTVNGPVTFNQPTTSTRNNAWNINASTASVDGLITFAGANTTTSRISQIVITSGLLNADGGMTFTGSANATKVINMSGGNAQLNLKGNLTVPANSGTLTAGTAGSIFNYADDTISQTVRFFPAGAYNILQLSNTSAGGATLSAAISATNVTSHTRVQAGTFANGGFAIVGAATRRFEVANGATFEMTGTSAFPSSYGTYSFGPTSRVRYLQTGALTLASQTYGHLDVMPAAGATRTFPAGAFTVQGDLTIGDGTNAATATANTNNTTLAVGGSLAIAANSSLTAHASNPLTVGGNWTNAGTFTHSGSVVAFTGSGAQTVDNGGQDFASVVSSNTGAGGLTFSSGFSATRLQANASGLSSSATMYFAAGSTFTIDNLSLMGAAAKPVGVLSTTEGSRWYLNNVSTHNAQYVNVEDSDASAGLRMLVNPAGTDLGNNVNWAVGLNAPASLSVTAAQTTSIDFAWPAAVPAGDTYTFSLSPNSNFSAPVTAASTALLSATTSNLLVNTTYYARVNAVINGSISAWSATTTTATLANAPISAASTWTAVNFTSVTVAWAANGNPASTRYTVRLSTVSDFLSGTIVSSVTLNTSAPFTSLSPATIYFAQVKAVNHYGIETAYATLGSTTTGSITAPSGLIFSNAATNQLTATWSATTPAGDSYTFQVSTASDFSGTITGINTAALTGLTAATLSINTTYYGRVNAVVNGSSSAWSASIATATLANTPSAAGTTWTAVAFTSASVAWAANGNPAAVTRYAVDLSTMSNFQIDTRVSSTTFNLAATLAGLIPSSTYYARAKAINHSNIDSSFLSLASTVTLANAPATAGTTWTTVNFTSVTVAWSANGNSDSALYTVQLATASNFTGTLSSSITYNVSATFASLAPATTYYVQVRAANPAGTGTAFVNLGSTVTLSANAPAGLGFTTSANNQLGASWSASAPAGNSYTFQVSTATDFSGTLTGFNTAGLSGTTAASLAVNTTYYGRVNAIVNGSSSAWSASVTTATLANIPATAASTWTAVNFTSATLNWTANGNPAGVTQYIAELSTVSGFTSGIPISSVTYNLSALFDTLDPGGTYYARVKSENHSGIDSAYVVIGSTVMKASKICFAVGTGLWSTTSIWSGCTGPGGIPAVSDSVTINSTITVTLNVNATVEQLTFAAATTANNALTQNAGTTLSVNGTVVFTQPTTTGRTSSWNINTGTATVTGAISMLGNNVNNRISQIVITSGQLNAYGGMSFVASAATNKVINLSGGAARVNLKGNISAPALSATLTAGTQSTFNYMDDALTQTVAFFPGGAYSTLLLNNTSPSGVSLGAAISASNVSSNTRVQSGTFKNGGFAIVGAAGRTFEVANGATFEMSGTSAFPATYATYSFGPTSRVRYLQSSAAVTVSTPTYGHLDLMPTGTATHTLPAGAFVVQGDLSLGNGTNTTTVAANTNNTSLAVGGSVSIAANAALTAHASNPLTVAGNWTNNGTFTHNNSTISFIGSSAQSINNGGKAFANVVSTNTSAAGLVFTSSFSAAKLLINTNTLNAAATVYFASGSTVTISTFAVAGAPTKLVSLLSNNNGSQWFINNTSTAAVSYAQVKDSNASAGRRVFVYPGGVDLGNNVNWAIGLNPPASISATAAQPTSLTIGWPAASPAGDAYILQVATAGNFTGTVTSSITPLLSGTTAGLSINTTYYARLTSVIYSATSTFSGTLTTATLANAPITAASTWTAVNFTSITVAWLGNGNPIGVTRYTVQLSTVADFLSGAIASSSTYNLNATFASLAPASTYYAQVQAVNHSSVGTAFLVLGSTVTRTVAPPTGLFFSSAAATQLSARWTAPHPSIDTYTLTLSTANNFTGAIISSDTALLIATTTGLGVNTTYYGRVNASINGSTSGWTATITTATLANAPLTAASTWTAVSFTSATVAWLGNGNPAGLTRFVVQLSTVSNFLSGATLSSATYNLSAIVSNLVPGSVYYGRVKATNHSGIDTAYLAIGSTATLLNNAPENFQLTAAAASSISASWDASFPIANAYNFQVSTASNFTGTLASSSTANTSATSPATLSANTTVYARVNAVVNGSSSAWSSSITTATLANVPTAAGVTWTGVNLTSVTIAWNNNGNPLNVTAYTIDFSTAAAFNGDDLVTVSTYALTTTFETLDPGATYYARVKATNHSGIDTAYLTLGSTKTLSPTSCNASTSGNWDEGATWTNCSGPGGVPSPTDIITVNSGVTVTQNVDATVGGIIFAAASVNNALTQLSTVTMTVNGTVVFNQPGVSSRNNSWNINGGTATVSGLISFLGNNATSSRVSRIVITSGLLNAFGGMTFTTSASATKLINMTGGAAMLNLKGNLTVPANSSTLSAGTAGSIFNYMDDVSAQTVQYFSAGAYNNLHLSNTSAAGIGLGGAITTSNVTGDVRVKAGTFKHASGVITGNGGATFEVADGATYEMSGTVAFPTGFSTLTFGPSSRVRYLQTTGTLTIGAQTYGHLDLMPAATATHNFAAGSITVQGDLSLGNGTNTTTVSANANATDLTVAGGVTINANASFAANSASALNVGGDWTNGGTFNANSGSVVFNGSATQTLSGSSTFYALSALTPNATIYFTAGTTHYVTSAIDLENVSLRSTADDSAWHLSFTGGSQTFAAVQVRDSNASLGSLLQTSSPSVNRGNNINWDFGAPSAVADLTAAPNAVGSVINLAWTAPGEDNSTGTLINSTYTIQYTTDTAFAQSASWSPTAVQPSHVYRVTIPTTSVTPGTAQRTQVTGLISGGTYYFRLWTKDVNANTSVISNGATTYATPVILGISLSTDTIQFGSLLPGTTNVITSSITVTNTGNVVQKFQIYIDTPAIWVPTTVMTGVDTFRLTGVFKNSLPASSDFSIVNDVITGSTTTATTAVHARDADSDSEKGFNVQPGEQRGLWFRIEMPPISTTTDEQTIRFHGTASQ